MTEASTEESDPKGSWLKRGLPKDTDPRRDLRSSGGVTSVPK